MSFHLCKTIKLILVVVKQQVLVDLDALIAFILFIWGLVVNLVTDTSQKLHPHVYLYTYFGVGCESCDRHVTKVASTGLFIYLFWGQNS